MQNEQREHGWGEYEKLILAELTRLNGTMEGLRNEIADFKVNQATTIGKLYSEIAMLKVKSSLFGAVAGAITVMSVLMIYYFRGMVK